MTFKILFLLLLAGIFARAEDWTTTDGQTYRDVTVVKIEDDTVTIRHSNGGGVVSLATLSPSLQKRFHYDPAKASVAAAARAKIDEEKAHAWRERLKQAAIASGETIAADPPPSPPTASSPPKPVVVAPAEPPARVRLAPEPAQGLTKDERASVTAQLDTLLEEVAFMEREEGKLTDDQRYVRTNGARVTQGGYAAKIVEERRQIVLLLEELDGTVPLGTVEISEQPSRDTLLHN